MLRDKFLELNSKSEDIVFSALLLAASAIFLMQVQSLYSVPVPDSYLWWGDESWLMLEFRNQIQHGIFAHPYALGSSLTAGSGIMFGNMWLTALFYGVPAALISPDRMDIVLLGRTVTVVFSLTLLVVLFEVVRNLTSEKVLGMLSVLMLLTSQSFLLTSHSARYDILSALAIIAGMYFLLRLKEVSLRSSATIGFLVAASMLVSVHVLLELAVVAIIIVAIRASNKWKCVAAFAGSSAAFIGIIIVVSALTGQLNVGHSNESGFALNIRDVPILRLYSRSVQFANLHQRWNMFSQYAMGFIFTFALLAVSAIVYYIRNRRLSFGHFAFALAIVFISWLEFESAAPSSYIIYILPVLSLAASLTILKVVPERFRYWLAAVLGVGLAILAFRDVPARHGKGYRIMTENSLALSAALNEIESDSSVAHLRVLTFTPAVHEVLRDTNVRIMTTQFVEYPAEDIGADSVVREYGVNYVLLYASALKPDYMREVRPIRFALDRIATPVWERPGYFTDIGRSYFDTVFGLPDTLRLYKINLDAH